MFNRLYLLIFLVVMSAKLNAAPEVNFGKNDEVVHDPFIDAVVVSDDCSTSSLENRPLWGWCSVSDIKRLASLKINELPPYDPEHYEILKSVGLGELISISNYEKGILDKQVSVLDIMMDLNKVQSEINAGVDTILADKSLSYSQMQDSVKVFQEENNQEEIWQRRRNTEVYFYESFAFSAYAYCLSGKLQACYNLESLIDGFTYLYKGDTLPASNQIFASRGEGNDPFIEESMALAELLREPAFKLADGPIGLYSIHREKAGYLGDADFSDRHTKLAEELLGEYRSTPDEATERLKEISHALMHRTNGYFRANYSDFFKIAERSCLEWENPQSCYELARAYRFAIQTPENHFLAETLYEKAISILPNYFAALYELASMRLEISSPTYNVKKALENLKGCVNSIYCPDTLAFVYASKLFPYEQPSEHERILQAEELWLSSLSNSTSARIETLQAKRLLEWNKAYNFAYTSPTNSDESIFKAALAGYQPAQFLLAQGYSHSIPSNLVNSKVHAYKWALLAGQDSAKGLSKANRERRYELELKLKAELSIDEQKLAHSLATGISRNALENFR